MYIHSSGLIGYGHTVTSSPHTHENNSVVKIVITLKTDSCEEGRNRHDPIEDMHVARCVDPVSWLHATNINVEKLHEYVNYDSTYKLYQISEDADYQYDNDNKYQ